VAHFFQSRDASAFQGGYYSSGKRFLAAVPIPEAKEKAKRAVTGLVQEMIALKGKRFRIFENGRHRLRVDVGNDAHAKLSKKLEEWPSLTFKELNDELFRLFKRQIAPQDRAYWEKHLDAQRNAIQTLDAKIKDLENSLNQNVYELFSLNEDEIRIVEGE
jgi:predicted ribosome quality control (RQC) complex YloA/Tae2 family protein